MSLSSAPLVEPSQDPLKPAVNILGLIRRTVDFLSQSSFLHEPSENENVVLYSQKMHRVRPEIEVAQRAIEPFLSLPNLDEQTNYTCFCVLQDLRELVVSEGHLQLAAFYGNRPFERLADNNFSSVRVESVRNWLARIDSCILLGRDLQDTIGKLDSNEFVRDNK